MCVAGVCVDPGLDEDMDGVNAAADCDDTNGAIGRMAERVCTGPCGAGVEQCSDGVWGACSAPTECDCSDGDAPRTIACPGCGTQTQVCMGGVWVDDGACETSGDGCNPGETRGGAPCGMCGMAQEICDLSCTWQEGSCEGESGECAPGDIDTDMESCGGCGTGTRTRTHSCSATCSWGSYGSWGTCDPGTGSGECSPGETETQSQACGDCGRQTRTRTCDSGCSWGAWSSWGSCSGQGPCSPGATSNCTGDRSGSGCVHRVCSSSCEWSSCQLKPGNACDWYTDDGRGGSRYRCCGGGSWQFCLSTCQWSTQCAACSGCGC